MKKWFLIAIPVLTGGVAITQDRPTHRMWYPGVSVELNSTYRTLRYDEQFEWIADMRNKDERPGFGMRGSAWLEYRPRVQYGITAGLGFSSSSYGTHDIYSPWPANEPGLPVESNIRFTYHSLELPLHGTWYFNLGRNTFHLSGGGSLNYLMWKKTTLVTKYSDGMRQASSDRQDTGYAPFSLAGMVAFGTDIHCGPKFMLRIAPVWRPYLTSITMADGAREYPYTVGLQTTLFYCAKKNPN